jgi:hypothetical protein
VELKGSCRLLDCSLLLLRCRPWRASSDSDFLELRIKKFSYT